MAAPEITRPKIIPIERPLNRPVVTVTNQQTGEVIRQIPNDVVIRMAHSIDETRDNLLNAKV